MFLSHTEKESTQPSHLNDYLYEIGLKVACIVAGPMGGAALVNLSGLYVLNQS